MALGVLCFESVFRGDGIEIADVAYDHRAGRGAPEWTEVRALELTARVLAQRDERRVGSGRQATIAARRALADGVRTRDALAQP